MLNEKKLLTKMLDRFRGCDNSRSENLGAVSSATPTKDGWLVAAATSTGASPAPVVRIQLGNSILSESIGIVGSGNMLLTACPVKAGLTYTINVYRSNVSSVINYY